MSRLYEFSKEQKKDMWHGVQLWTCVTVSVWCIITQRVITKKKLREKDKKKSMH